MVLRWGVLHHDLRVVIRDAALTIGVRRWRALRRTNVIHVVPLRLILLVELIFHL